MYIYIHMHTNTSTIVTTSSIVMNHYYRMVLQNYYHLDITIAMTITISNTLSMTSATTFPILIATTLLSVITVPSYLLYYTMSMTTTIIVLLSYYELIMSIVTKTIWRFPKIGGTPKSSIFMGFSLTKTIHNLGFSDGFPMVWGTPFKRFRKPRYVTKHCHPRSPESLLAIYSQAPCTGRDFNSSYSTQNMCVYIYIYILYIYLCIDTCFFIRFFVYLFIFLIIYLCILFVYSFMIVCIYIYIEIYMHGNHVCLPRVFTTRIHIIDFHILMYVIILPWPG